MVEDQPGYMFLKFPGQNKARTPHLICLKVDRYFALFVGPLSRSRCEQPREAIKQDLVQTSEECASEPISIGWKYLVLRVGPVPGSGGWRDETSVGADV
jgi:hypothetical protein